MSNHKRSPVSGLGVAISENEQGDFTLPPTLYYDAVAFYINALNSKDGSNSSERNKRASIQSLFSFVEAEVNQIAFAHANAHKTKLPQAELDVLEEMETQLSSKGEIVRSERYYPFEARFLMLIQFLSGKKMDRGSALWQKFIIAIKIRHKLTHPKPPFDREIDINEVWDAIETVYGIFDELSTMMNIEMPLWFVKPEKLVKHFHETGVVNY